MRLRLLLPDRVAVDRQVERVSAEGCHGQFTLLPRHVDAAVALVPGLLSFVAEGTESFFAVAAGTLVKQGTQVLVATTEAVPGPDLDELEQAVRRSQRAVAAHETEARNALARIETDLVQRFVELEERTRA